LNCRERGEDQQRHKDINDQSSLICIVWREKGRNTALEARDIPGFFAGLRCGRLLGAFEKINRIKP
jgi:hypothetical protein